MKIGIDKDFYGQTNPPRKLITKTTEQEESHTKKCFFNEDLLMFLGQGPIKKDPLKNKEKVEEKNTPEMEAQIEKLFGDTEFSF